MALEGRPPPPGDAGPGCSFVDRCAIAESPCRAERPGLQPLLAGGRVRCRLPERAESIPTKRDGKPASAGGSFGEPLVRLSNLAISYARQSLVDFTECAALAAPEVDRPRIESNAIAVRLNGPAAEARERRMAAELNTQDGEV